jgi:hypothetical protein
MGFWNSLWSGLKLAGQSFAATLEGGFTAVKGAVEGASTGASAGGEFGGILGGIVGGVKGAIDGVSTTVNRIKHYAHEAEHPNGIAAAVKPLDGVKTMTDAVNSAKPGAPDTVLDVARTGAKFMDGAAKYGDLVAASKHAGATPITKHMGHNISRSVVNEVAAQTGFRGDLHQLLHNPVTRSANTLPTTSAWHDSMQDVVHHGGAEAAAVKHMMVAKGNPATQQVIVGGI